MDRRVTIPLAGNSEEQGTKDRSAVPWPRNIDGKEWDGEITKSERPLVVVSEKDSQTCTDFMDLGPDWREKIDSGEATNVAVFLAYGASNSMKFEFRPVIFISAEIPDDRAG